MKINVAGIINESIVDGPGIRLTVFCQGCPHHCPGCQNPETWEFVEKTRELVQPDQIVWIDGSEKQLDQLRELAKLLRAEGYEVAAYTGYTFEQLMQGTAEQRLLLENIDVLVDGPFLIEERTLEARFRGSRNQRVLDVPQSLKEERAVLMTRENWVGEQAK